MHTVTACNLATLAEAEPSQRRRHLYEALQMCVQLHEDTSQFDIIKCLVASGAPLKWDPSMGSECEPGPTGIPRLASPLHLARSIDVAKWLIEWGADIISLDHSGETALMALKGRGLINADLIDTILRQQHPQHWDDRDKHLINVWIHEIQHILTEFMTNDAANIVTSFLQPDI